MYNVRESQIILLTEKNPSENHIADLAMVSLLLNVNKYYT